MSLLRGLFDEETDDLLRRFASSLDIDLLMAEEDIQGSMAHAMMLGEAGLLSDDEAVTLHQGLERIRDELREGLWAPDDSQEDIHMAVEARLIELVGPVGGKLHTARSRNDQVATDVRLWLRRSMAEMTEAVRDLTAVLLDRIESDGHALIPGYTHLQRGQPIILGHHLLAHCWALSRDLERIADVTRRVNRCPLGSCALAGTPHPIDRDRTAEILGFDRVLENAMDGVSSRDHLQEAAAVCAICMCHLSRMAEEMVLWSSSEFSLIKLDERHATGSSIMPQKRNPDGAELVRGKAGVVFSHLHALLALAKGLPLAYNRDLQEERRPTFEAVGQTVASIRVMGAMWRALEVKTDRFESELWGDPCLATELADVLVDRGIPFREAHHAVAAAVKFCHQQGGDLTLLDGGVAQRFHSEFPADLGPWLDPRAAAERRTSKGGTAPGEVARQVTELRRIIATE